MLPFYLLVAVCPPGGAHSQCGRQLVPRSFYSLPSLLLSVFPFAAVPSLKAKAKSNRKQ